MRLQKAEEAFLQPNYRSVLEEAVQKKGGICIGCPMNEKFQTTLHHTVKLRKINSDAVTVRVCCKQYPSPVKPVTEKVCGRRLHSLAKKTLAEWKEIQKQQAVASAHPS